jgi:glycosyltransferase involved in cell wall biosynthesis
MISLYEGFGLPALEAMNCGLAGIVSDNSSLPEVTGRSAVQVPPQDESRIEQALQTLAENESLRKNMAAEALDRCKQFSIQKTASRMIEIFKKECRS